MSNSPYKAPDKSPVDPRTGQYSYKPSGQKNKKPPKKKFPKWLLILIAVFLFFNFGLPILGGIGIELQGKLGNDDGSDNAVFFDAPTDEEMQALQAADDAIFQIEVNHHLDGYVPSWDVETCVNEVADYAAELVKQGVLEDYSNDGSSVWMIDEDGLQTIYVPVQEDTLALNANEYYSIMTIEPHEGTFSSKAELWSDKNAEAAVRLDGISEPWTYTADIDTYSVTPETVKQFGENQIILWFGHGAWAYNIGPALITAERFDSYRYMKDKEYHDQFTEGYFARTAGTESKVIITAKYISANAGSMKNSVIFLGACSSTKGPELVSAFMQKGALAVVGNSADVLVYYYTHMLESMVQTLCSKDASGQYNTFGTALSVARQQYGYDDSQYGGKHAARVELYGVDAENLRITDIVTEPTVPETAPAAVDYHQVLSNYAAQFSYLNGTTGYTGFYTKTQYQNVYSYSLPDQPVASTIADFDMDNAEELLIVDTNADNTVHLEMYEVVNGGVVCTAEMDLPVPVAGSAEDGITEYFYFYRNGRLQICVSEFSLANRVATGTILRCSGAIYDGTSFSYQGMAEIIGTAGEGDPFAGDMAALGIENVNLYDMLSGYKLATDYLSNCTVFCTARSMCTIMDGEWMTYQDVWFTDDSLTYLEISYIGFKKDLLSA